MTEDKKTNKKKIFSCGLIGATTVLVAALAIALVPATLHDKKPDIPSVSVGHPVPPKEVVPQDPWLAEIEPLPEEVSPSAEEITETSPEGASSLSELEEPSSQEDGGSSDFSEYATYIEENGPIAETKYRNVGSAKANGYSTVITVCGDGVFTISNKDASVLVLDDGVLVEVDTPLSVPDAAQYNIRMGGGSKATGKGVHSILSMSYVDREGKKIGPLREKVNSLTPETRKKFAGGVKALIKAVRKEFPSDVPAANTLICDASFSGAIVLKNNSKTGKAFFQLVSAVQSETGKILFPGLEIYKKDKIRR